MQPHADVALGAAWQKAARLAGWVWGAPAPPGIDDGRQAGACPAGGARMGEGKGQRAASEIRLLGQSGVACARQGMAQALPPCRRYSRKASRVP